MRLSVVFVEMFVCLFVGRGRGVVLGVLGFLDFLPGCCLLRFSPPPPLKRRTEEGEVVCVGSKYNMRSIVCLRSSARVASIDGSSNVEVLGDGEKASLSLLVRVVILMESRG